VLNVMLSQLEWDDRQLAAAAAARAASQQGGGRRRGQAPEPLAPVWPSRREQLREALLDALVGVTVFKVSGGGVGSVVLDAMTQHHS
jgi:hypothetical protein